jgi:formate dehydrogenase major subunit
LSENPLIGRRIVMASDKGIEIFSADYVDKSITSINSDNYFKFSSITEFLDNFPKEIEDKLDENSVIIFNELESKENYEEILEIAKKNNSKTLPVLADANSFGTMNYLQPYDKNELIDMISNIKVLIVVNSDIVDDWADDEINHALKGLDSIILLSDSFKETMNIFDYIIPIPSWVEKDGTFTNTIGELQNFEKVIDSDLEFASIEEIFNNISKNLAK